jgi:hypothetical protein
LPTEIRERPPYLVAAAFTALVLAVYIATLAPTTAFWDTSEYIAAAKVLGIPHPPGNPLFTLMAHVFALLPLAESYAVRINLFSALTSAAAAGLWFLVAERWLRPVVPVRWARHAAAASGILVGAMSWTVWNQSTVNEKVYTVSLLSIALVMWFCIHWGDEPEGPRRDRWLVLIAYTLALSSTNHQMGVLAAPAVAMYVLWTDWRVITKPWLWATVIGAVVVGISINYLFLPIRAGQYPAINEGEPVGFFSQALKDVLSREQYQKPPVNKRQADFVSQVQNYWQYFSWQFARDWPAARRVFTGIFAALGVFGLATYWRYARREGVMAAVLFFTLIPLLIFYLNFKYGFSMHPDQPDLPREVRERDYFFVASFAAWGLLVAGGIGGLMRWLADTLGSKQGRANWVAASPVLALGLIPLVGNRTTATRAHETAARDFAVDLLQSVEPYGILITAGDNDTFPLWYAQEVEGIRPDVTVANLSLMNTRWHLRQLRRREIPDFDINRGVALWGADTAGAAGATRTTGSWPKPTIPVFGFTVEQLDSLPDYMQVQRGSGVQVDSVEIRFGQDVLFLQDLAVLALIRQNLGKRPIFFSWSDGSYPDQTLGLTDYLVTQGMVRKLTERRVAVVPDSIVDNPILGAVDLPRTNSLLWNAYHWEAIARPRPRGWVDPPSSSILQLYAVVYRGMAETYAAMGDTVKAQRADSIAQAIRVNLQPIK